MAQYAQAQCYELALGGVAEDLERAQRLYEEAALAGRHEAVVGAAFTTTEPKAALQWIQRAAEFGEALCQYQLGCMLYAGEDIQLSTLQCVCVCVCDD